MQVEAPNIGRCGAPSGDSSGVWAESWASVPPHCYSSSTGARLSAKPEPAAVPLAFLVLHDEGEAVSAGLAQGLPYQESDLEDDRPALKKNSPENGLQPTSGP